MMRLLLVIASLLVPSIAFGADPFARATLENSDGIVPGQQLLVDVDIYVPDFFTTPPQFPLFDLPNALVTLPAERSQNLTETIDGVQYTGIRKTYAVVPQISGTFTLPEFSVEFGYSSAGQQGKASVMVPSVSFTVEGSPNNEEQQVSFAATNLTLEQTFDRDAKSLKVGDALIRTITITAQNTQAMMIPPLEVGTASGLRQYEKSPAIEDGIELGRDTASRRTETYEYTADKEGSFVIPPISYTWFDVANRQTKTASLPSIAITVTAASSSGTAIKPVLDGTPQQPPHIKRQKIAIAIAMVLAFAALLWIGAKIFPALKTRIDSAKERRHASYGYRLRQLRQTIKDGSEMEVYSAVLDWSRTLGYRNLMDWLRDAPEGVRSEIDTLSQKLFKPAGGTFDRKKLAASIDFRKVDHFERKTGLPPLNP